MGKAMVRYDLAELRVLRLRCRECDTGAIELPVRQENGAWGKQTRCTYCGNELVPPADAARILELQTVLAWLGDESRRFAVEFDLPAK
jgi:hypothetical protein